MVRPAELQCRLLSGAPALFAQLLLAVLAFGILIWKRHRERPQRPYKIWTMDVSKQVFSSGAGHICGLIIAFVASSSVQHETSECAWYFVAYTFDTTLGVTLAILIHRWFVRRAISAVPASDPESALEQPKGISWAQVIANCGDYGEPPSWHRWAIQMAEWVFATVVARAFCGVVVVLAHHPLRKVASLLDLAFEGHTTAELFAVMICCPLLMNMIQAWIQDAVLKLKRSFGGGFAADSATTDEMALLAQGGLRSDTPLSPEAIAHRHGRQGGKRNTLTPHPAELPTVSSPMEGSSIP